MLNDRQKPKINYNKMMEKEIEGLKREQKPKLLLQVCCAPCSSHVLSILKEHFYITAYYYNPNIYPEKEFYKREGEIKKLLNHLDLKESTLIVPNYDHNEFCEIVKGNEKEPEGGARCRLCFELRMEKAAIYAKKQGYDYFTTTLSISPHKNSQLLNEIGFALEKRYQVRYLPSDFKKKEGYKHSIELSKEFGLYRQDYCGCEFSKI